LILGGGHQAHVHFRERQFGRTRPRYYYVISCILLAQKIHMKKVVAFPVLLFSYGGCFEAKADHKPREAIAPCLLQHGQTLRESISKDEGRGPASELDRVQIPAFLQTQSSAEKSVTKSRINPAFFDSFSDAESSWDADGSADQNQVQVSDAASMANDVLPTIKPAEWFAETPSAGAKEAWQTYDAASQDASWRASAPQWRELDFGRIRQGWAPADSRLQSRSASHGKDATWFEKSVNQQDYFGRPRAPSPSSAKFYLEWSQVSRTAELSCGPPGCVANTSLQAFKEGDLEYKMCTLSVMVHPTDFDDEYNVEKIEWITINGKEALRDFSPRAPKGCETNGNRTGILDSDLEAPNETDPSLLASSVRKAHRVSNKSNQSVQSGNGSGASNSTLPLYPCIRDLPLEGLVGEDGTIHVSGKISPAVDECAVNGNHLSGLVSVTCFARPITTLPPTTTTTTTPESEVTVSTKQEFKTKDSAHFRCKDPGCSAATMLSVDVYNLTSRKCFLTVRINQTDFDEQDGTTERIESVKVNRKVKASDFLPGKNPCREAIAFGSNRKYETATVLQKEDVTDEIKSGLLMVELKITEMVDECGVDEHLLDGEANVSCEG